MADKSWKQGKKMMLDTTVQIETWKQKIGTEQRQVRHVTAQSILNQKQNLTAKNTYIKNYKKREALKEIDKSNNFFVYDQVKADTEAKQYCQKSKYESVWDKNVRERYGLIAEENPVALYNHKRLYQNL